MSKFSQKAGDFSNIVALFVVFAFGLDIVLFVLLLLWRLMFGTALGPETCLSLARPHFNVDQISRLIKGNTGFDLGNFCQFRLPLVATTYPIILLAVIWGVFYKFIELFITGIFQFKLNSVLNIYIYAFVLFMIIQVTKFNISEKFSSLNGLMSYIIAYPFLDVVMISFIFAAQRRLNEIVSVAD